MTTLPEKWAIKPLLEKDIIIVKDWFEKKLEREVAGDRCYWHYPEVGKTVCTTYGLKPGYTEISFEEFEELVVNKEIIYRLKDLINNNDVVVFINSEYEWKQLNDTNLFNMCDYKGPYCYSLVTHTYSSASTKNYNGGYDNTKIVQFNQINFENMKKKIIGYKAPFDLTDGTGAVAVKKDHLFVKEDYHYNAQDVILFGLPKEIVEQWEPVYEEALKMGDWIVITGNRETYWLKDTNESIFQVTAPKSSYYGSHLFTIENPVSKDKGGLYTDYRMATPDEIKSIENRLLIQEAQKRYPAGTKFKPAHLKNHNTFSEEKCVSTGKFVFKEGTLQVDIQYDSCVDAVPVVRNSDGKWAEIVPTFPEITIRGYKAVFTKDSVKFGCQELKRDFVIDLFKLLDKNKIDMEFKKELQDIVMFFKKKENETSNNL